MATAKTTVKKSVTPVKAAYVTKTAAVGISSIKPPAAKAPTKADLEERVKNLATHLKNSEDMRLSAVTYRDKLAVEKGHLAAEKADLLKQQQGLMDTQVELQSLVSSKVAYVEKLLGEQKLLKQSNDTYASQNEKLWEEKKRLEAENKRLGHSVKNHAELHEAVKVEARNAAARLNKVPAWIRWFFNA